MIRIKKFLGRFPLVRKVASALRGGASTPSEAIDLKAIEAFSLPANPDFQVRAGAIQRIEGMFSPFSTAAMDMMLSFQEAAGAKGDVLEIGTYKGKSAALLGRHLRQNERLVLVDIAPYLDPAAIEPFSDKTDFILSSSAELRKSLPRYRDRHGSFRFIHIDASHGYEETFHELQLANELLAPMGIISMDDFTNLNYGQNIAAIFKYLYTARSDLTMLLTTDEKGYLCRKKDFAFYAGQILNRSIAEMKSRSIDAVLARTSYGTEYKAFYLRNRLPGEVGAFYGIEIYSRAIIG